MYHICISTLKFVLFQQLDPIVTNAEMVLTSVFFVFVFVPEKKLEAQCNIC